MKEQRKTYLDGWGLYPMEALGHHWQGFAAGYAILGGLGTEYIVAGVLWATLYVAYQGLSVIRKKDSAGLDVMDFMVGFGIFTIIFIVIKSIGIIIAA